MVVRVRQLVALGTLLACATACPGAKPSAQTGTDLATLSRLVSLPVSPRAVQWRTQTLGEPGLGPTDWELRAVLELSDADARALVGALAPIAGEPGSWSAEARTWLTPARVSALSGATFYDAAPLGRAPLLSGTLAQLKERGVFVLVLHTR